MMWIVTSYENTLITEIIVAITVIDYESQNCGSEGWDHFPAIVAKQCINGYIIPLTHVINTGSISI